MLICVVVISIGAAAIYEGLKPDKNENHNDSNSGSLS